MNQTYEKKYFKYKSKYLYLKKLIGETNVKQGKFIITEKENILTTNGLATCTGLGMTFGKYKFLLHIDAETNIEPIIQEIKRYLEQEHLTTDNITSVIIWKGSGFGNANSDYTNVIAKLILLTLNIHNIQMNSVDIIDLGDKVQCNICKSISGTTKILSHYFTCKYKEKIEEKTVSYMDKIQY
jgi:hypothetical protein